MNIGLMIFLSITAFTIGCFIGSFIERSMQIYERKIFKDIGRETEKIIYDLFEKEIIEVKKNISTLTIQIKTINSTIEGIWTQGQELP